jgi:ABC-type nickel/cobalt efflux system permease component RcnA
MKKTLGFLFGLYFFVIQVVVIGFMFQLSQLYTLAIINFIVLGILALIARRGDKHDDHEKHHHEHKEEHKEEVKKPHHHENKEAVAPTHLYEPAGKKKTGNSSLIPFVISLIAAIILYSISSGADLGVRILLISLGASILFWILTIIWRAHRKGFNRLFGTRLYRVLVVIGIVIVGFQYFGRNIGKAQSIFTYLGQEITSMRLVGGSSQSLS